MHLPNAGLKLVPQLSAPASVNSGGVATESEVRMRRKTSVEARFWSKVQKGDLCWTWIGGTFTEGYGAFSPAAGRRVRAHRYAYELVVGPIPEGLVLDHLCRNILCVNPAHLEPVTSGENVLRGEGPPAKRARQTHCKRGHPLSGPNLHIDNHGYSCEWLS